MQAGRLNQKITLQQKVVGRDAYGAETVTWETFATPWAEAQPISGREFVAMRQAQADITIRFRLRYLAGVNPAMRISWNGGVYAIVSVIDVNARHTELELLCRGEALDA